MIDYLEHQLLGPDLLGDLLTALIARRRNEARDFRQRQAELRRRVTDIRARQARLYDAIETGAVDARDPYFKERLQDLQRLRDETQRAADQKPPAADGDITPCLLHRFTVKTRKMLHGEDGTFRRELVRAVADAHRNL